MVHDQGRGERCIETLYSSNSTDGRGDPLLSLLLAVLSKSGHRHLVSTAMQIWMGKGRRQRWDTERARSVATIVGEVETATMSIDRDEDGNSCEHVGPGDRAAGSRGLRGAVGYPPQAHTMMAMRHERQAMIFWR